MDPTKIRLIKDRMIVQELTSAKVGAIYLPKSLSAGMQGYVLNVADTELCEDIYPGDTALLKNGAQNESLGDRVFVVHAVDVWGVIRDGKPMPVNHHVMVEVDPEEDDVDADTGIWTATESRDYPSTGWANYDGAREHVHYNVMGPQRRIKIGEQVYAFMALDNLTGYVEE